MRVSYNDLTIDVHFSPSAHNLEKDDIVDTAVSLAASVPSSDSLLVDVGVCEYVIVRGETGHAHVDVVVVPGPLTFSIDSQVDGLDIEF